MTYPLSLNFSLFLCHVVFIDKNVKSELPYFRRLIDYLPRVTRLGDETNSRFKSTPVIPTRSTFRGHSRDLCIV